MKKSATSRTDFDQSYFWTDEWQKGEREADEDLASGNTVTFTNAEDAIAWLTSEDDDGP